ncbi:MAG: UvrD-helicase domain-containing protein, partial [Alphaproteobacteria bacterium]|nr:UvrD-helicase domain-containing protein [Alphaproteobacteria bacterium]
MTNPAAPLAQLTPEQCQASMHNRNVWLTASAGTGKTQVLVARVLRLLLNGVAPEAILCLTFTRNGAAEMATRIQSRLAMWVRASAKFVHADLAALDEKRDATAIEKARGLFARVLDARGGGLRIMTIHSFCQTLLAAFPAEAGLPQGFRALDEAETRALARTVLADLIVEAHDRRDTALLDRFARFVRVQGEQGVHTYLDGCARHGPALIALGAGIEAQVRRKLGLPAEDVMPDIVARCSDDAPGFQLLIEIQQANRDWNTKNGENRAEQIEEWFELSPDARVRNLDQLIEVWRRKDGGWRSFEKKFAPQDPDYESICHAADDYYSGLRTLIRLQQLAGRLTDQLMIGQRYAQALAKAKALTGVVDFDDLIRITVALLHTPGMGDWIRYKLDQGTDHILVDEAQDTNEQQWAIIEALAEEFYAGDGAKDGISRTLFVVGDAKQAIFSFQGTNPHAMFGAQQTFAAHARDVGHDFFDLDLSRSYRSSPPILAFVDAVIEAVGASGMGLEVPSRRHIAAQGQAGQVLLLPPVVRVDDETALSTQMRLANMIAARIMDSLDPVHGLWLESRGG